MFAVEGLQNSMQPGSFVVVVVVGPLRYMCKGTASCFPVLGRNEDSPMSDSAEAPAAVCLWAMNLEGWRFPPTFSVTCCAVLKPYGFLIDLLAPGWHSWPEMTHSPLLWGRIRAVPFALGPFCGSLQGWCAPPALSGHSEVFVKCTCTLHVMWSAHPHAFYEQHLDGASMQLSFKEDVKQWEDLCCSTLWL